MSGKSKICLAVPYLSGQGGTETILTTVSQLLINDYDVTILFADGVGDVDWPAQLPEQVKTVMVSHSNKITRLLKIGAFVLKSNFDAYIALSTSLIFLFSAFRKLALKKYHLISWIHYSIYHEQTVNPKFLKLADYHLAISSGIQREIEQLGINPETIFLVYNCVPRQTEIKYQFQPKMAEFIYLGRVTFEGQKNVKLLLDSLAGLKSDWHLTVFGDGADLKHCQNYAEKLEISDQISWNGFVKHPWRQVNKATALLLASNYEGFPMVVLEAMSFGLPVVTTNCPTGPSDIVKNDQNGYLVPLGSIGAYTQALEQVSQHSFDVSDVQESIGAFYLASYTKRMTMTLSKILRKEPR